MSYLIRFDVLADGRLEAIAKATAKLRTGVKLIAVVEAEQSTPGWWSVQLSVSEDA